MSELEDFEWVANIKIDFLVLSGNSLGSMNCVFGSTGFCFTGVPVANNRNLFVCFIFLFFFKQNPKKVLNTWFLKADEATGVS